MLEESVAVTTTLVPVCAIVVNVPLVGIVFLVFILHVPSDNVVVVYVAPPSTTVTFEPDSAIPVIKGEESVVYSSEVIIGVSGAVVSFKTLFTIS